MAKSVRRISGKRKSAKSSKVVSKNVSKKTGTWLKSVTKRDGRVVPFDKERITAAVTKAMVASGELREGAPEIGRDGVVAELRRRHDVDSLFVPNVENIQD